MLVMANEVCSTLNCCWNSWSRWLSYSRFCFSTCAGGGERTQQRAAVTGPGAGSRPVKAAALIRAAKEVPARSSAHKPRARRQAAALQGPRTTSARRLAASCAGPRIVLIFCLCCASCSSSLRIFSSSLRAAQGGCRRRLGGRLPAAAAAPTGPAAASTQAPHVSPRVFSLSTASSIVGVGAAGFLEPKMRRMAAWLRACERAADEGESEQWPAAAAAAAAAAAGEPLRPAGAFNLYEAAASLQGSSGRLDAQGAKSRQSPAKCARRGSRG